MAAIKKLSAVLRGIQIILKVKFKQVLDILHSEHTTSLWMISTNIDIDNSYMLCLRYVTAVSHYEEPCLKLKDAMLYILIYDFLILQFLTPSLYIYTSLFTVK